MSLAREIHHYELGVQRLYLHDWAEGTTLYKRAGTATTPTELAGHDGPVLLDGDDAFRRVEEEEDGLIRAYHPHAGRMELWAPQDDLDGEAVLLREVDRA